LKKNKLLWPLAGVAATIFLLIIGIVMNGGPKGWATAHSMKLDVWVIDAVAFAVGALIFYVGNLMTTNERVKEEHQEQLEATIRQAQQLEQENIQLCDELDMLQAQGVGDPAALDEARHTAERLQAENSKLLAHLRDLEEENAVNIRKFQDDNERLQDQLRALENSHRENQSMLEGVLRQVADLEQTNNDLNRQLAERGDAPVYVGESAEELEAARLRMSQLEEKNTELVAQLQTVEQRYRSNEAQLNKALSQVSDLEQANAALYRKISEMEVSNSGEQTRVSSALNVVHQLEEENAQLREQIKSLETTNAESQAYFHRTVAQLEARNRELQDQIDTVQAGNVSTRTYVEDETRRMTEQLLETFRLQIEAQSHQMDAVAHALQYHRAELAQLRQEMRVMKGTAPAAAPTVNTAPAAPATAPAPMPPPPAPVAPPVAQTYMPPAKPTELTPTEVVANWRTNGFPHHEQASATTKPVISMVVEPEPQQPEPIALVEVKEPAQEKKSNEDEIYLSLLRSRMELEERMRQARYTGS
jgi:chromosome segregation ATPase